ncbi:HAD-IA family hydrolase [Deinococcus sp. YIM 134068]|uniref:HAD family hydrolase n=1 Tax=Deinococcus lichenicola TaxID=3118910 RepID=UPI002F937256
MSGLPFDAILFDFDGVLVDSEGLGSRAWVEALGEHGLTFTVEDFAAAVVGRTHSAVYDWLRTDHGWTPPKDFQTFLDGRFEAVFEELLPIEGAHATLAALRAAGIPFAVASNTEPGKLHPKLVKAGLADLIGGHAYDLGSVHGRGKPQPDIYVHAAAALGVPPVRCVVVEDSLTGATAGVAAGATVWGMLATGHAHPANTQALLDVGAARVLRSHAELQEALGLNMPT